MASTTLAECIQERTASGSSFILAVAPRGRLSWIPNILGAPEVPPAPLHHQKDKTAGGGTNRRKVLEEKEGLYGMTEDLPIWSAFSGIKISETVHTQRRKGKRREKKEEEEEKKRREKSEGKGKQEEEEVCRRK